MTSFEMPDEIARRLVALRVLLNWGRDKMAPFRRRHFQSHFVPKGSINNIPALVQIIAKRRPGDTPLSEPMMVSLLTHIYISLGLNELNHYCWLVLVDWCWDRNFRENLSCTSTDPLNSQAIKGHDIRIHGRLFSTWRDFNYLKLISIEK